jgi:hypothetical protein|tara:strand:- start:1019 stop:1372 length:354 start_codon:yes stop_codon:yes gene_type:complete
MNAISNIAINFTLIDKYVNIITKSNNSENIMKINGYLTNSNEKNTLLLKVPLESNKKISNKYSIDPLYFSCKPPLNIKYYKLYEKYINQINLDPIYYILSKKGLNEDVITIIINFIF